MKYGYVGIAVVSMALLGGIPFAAARGLDASGTPPDAPPPASCEARPLVLDMARLKSAAGVQSVVADASTSHVTVLFANGDVLRIGTMGCTSDLLAARLWVADRTFLPDTIWFAKAKFVTDLVLDAEQARRLDESLKTPRIERQPNGGMSIENLGASAPHYAMTVTGRPADNLGLSMSIVYLK
jgi:hypothetical protein